MRSNLLLVLAIALWALPGYTQQQNQSKLPAGYYIFMGRKPGTQPPKAVTITDDGSIHWEGKSESKKAAEFLSQPNARSNPSAMPGEFEKYEYPFIKWKPKMLSTGALVQLETTMEDSGVKRGRLKYKITVFVKGGALVPSRGMRVELLDDKGFALSTFSIASSSLGMIPGTSVMEARGDAFITEDEYKKAVDYSVK